MTIEDGQLPGGNDQALENNPSPVENPPSPVDDGGKADKVAYESYHKLLSEKKKLQSELEQFRTEAEKKQQEELERQQKYKELWESTKSESEKLKQDLMTYEERWNDALKLDAFNQALGDTRKIDPKYSVFIDTSKILLDPETGKIDSLSAQKEVERVMNEYPDIVKSTVKGTMPNQNPSPTATLTYEQWKQLPASEMRKRLKEVIK